MVCSQKFRLTRTLTIFGCFRHFSNMLISRSDVIGKPSRSFSIFNRFRATISSKDESTDCLFYSPTFESLTRFLLDCSVNDTVSAFFYMVQTFEFCNIATAKYPGKVNWKLRYELVLIPAFYFLKCFRRDLKWI